MVAQGTPAEVAANPDIADRRLPVRPPAHRGAGACAARCRTDRVIEVVGATRQQPEERHRRRFRSAPSPASPACPAAASPRWWSTRCTRRRHAALMGSGEVPAPHDAHRRAGPARQDHRHRPVADRPHAAQQPRHLHRPVRADPRLVRRTAGKPRARLQARPLQLQRQGRPLRGLPGRRRAEDRDALPARRVRHLRHLQGRAATTAKRWKSSSATSRSPTCWR